MTGNFWVTLRFFRICQGYKFSVSYHIDAFLFTKHSSSKYRRFQTCNTCDIFYYTNHSGLPDESTWLFFLSSILWDELWRPQKVGPVLRKNNIKWPSSLICLTLDHSPASDATNELLSYIIAMQFIIERTSLP